MGEVKHLFYSMQLSWYSAKVRPYLRYRGIAFDERTPTFLEYNVRIRRRVGHAVVPVVVTPEGEWLQDSSVIIERLDERFRGDPVVPVTPRQRFAAYLLELWADEFWLPAGVHARWSFPANYPKWRDELSEAFAPGLPTFIQRLFPQTLRMFMQRVNAQLGATPGQVPLIERWMAQHLDHLDRHFATMPYVFGARPSLADFALAGPICGHMRYDEASAERLIRPRRHLYAWTEKMWSGVPAAEGPLVPGDEVPETLNPMFDSAFREMTPFLKQIAEKVRNLSHGPGGHLPRVAGPVTFPMAGETFTRHATPYTLWMAQRVLEVLAAMPREDADDARRWTESRGGRPFLELGLPRVKRVNVHAALD